MVGVVWRSGQSTKQQRLLWSHFCRRCSSSIGVCMGGALIVLLAFQLERSSWISNIVTSKTLVDGDTTTTPLNQRQISANVDPRIFNARGATPTHLLLESPQPKLTNLHAVVQQSRLVPRRNPPTHQSCREDHVQGIYHVSMGDIGGAAGTIFYQFVIAQILYAERHHLIPWIHFSNVSHVIYDPIVHGTATGPTVTARTGRNATYVKNVRGHLRDYTPGPPNASLPTQLETMQFPGTGVWEHYFEPVSDFMPGDASCRTKLYVTMDLYLITPGLHTFSRYAPKCWRYKTLPDYISQPHLSVTEWLAPQRKLAHDVVRRYIRPRGYLQDAANAVNPECSIDRPCLGIHIRHSDKASGRRVIETDEFLPFVQAFLDATTGAGGIVYLATDSMNVLSDIQENWPADVTLRIRSAGTNVLRSNGDAAVFDIGVQDHHRTNVEALVEILALSKCQFLVHGFSAVAEAAIWTNIDLHDTSVNLEDEEHIDENQFQDLVDKVLGNEPKNQWPRAVTIGEVWPELYDKSMRETITTLRGRREPTGRACIGFNGVLLISKVGRDATAGKAFFSSVLNQLAFAERNNLKPWIHLEANDAANSLIFDEQEHGTLPTKQVQMMNGSNAKLSRPLHGNGIWESYFQPVSDFVPGDSSCQKKPLVEQEDDAIESVSIRDDLLSALASNSEKQFSNSSSDIQARWRRRGSDIVSKYYMFQPYILNRADQVNHPLEWDQPCLGVHLRNGDKPGKDRKKVSPKAFVPYIEEFAKSGGNLVYVASDSHRAIHFLKNNLPDDLVVQEMIQTQGVHVVRSTKLDWPLHMIDDHHHRVNAEVLVDIIGLSRCVALLHSSSTTSEAVMYLKPELIHKSVNLEDDSPMSVKGFGDLLIRTKALVKP